MKSKDPISVGPAINGKHSANIEMQFGWNYLEIIPYDKNHEVLKPATDKYKLVYTFSEVLRGSGEIDLESNRDGSSLFHLDLDIFRANFNGKIEKPAGFIFEINTERGPVNGKIDLNVEKNICGCTLSVAANDFNDSFIFATTILAGFLNNLVFKYTSPLYINRIVSKNDAGEMAVWILGGPRLKKWDGKLDHSSVNMLKLHALSLKKEAINNYHSPGLVILAHIKLYELFRTIGIQAGRRGFTKIAKSVDAVMAQSVPDSTKMTFKTGFEFLEKEFRNPLAHGHLSFGADYVNIDTPRYFIETLKYLDQANKMSDVIFNEIMKLPKDFLLQVSQTRKTKNKKQ